MKAVLLNGYGGVEQLEYKEVPTPEPQSGEALVRVISTSINPVDYKLRSGAMKDHMKLDLPTILGRDVAGEVTAVGAGVSKVQGRRQDHGDGQPQLCRIPDGEC